MDGLDDPDGAAYWRHKAANTRYAASGVLDADARRILLEIAERYESIAGIVDDRGPLTRRGRSLRAPTADAPAGRLALRRRHADARSSISWISGPGFPAHARRITRPCATDCTAWGTRATRQVPPAARTEG